MENTQMQKGQGAYHEYLLIHVDTDWQLSLETAMSASGVFAWAAISERIARGTP